MKRRVISAASIYVSDNPHAFVVQYRPVSWLPIWLCVEKVVECSRAFSEGSRAATWPRIFSYSDACDFASTLNEKILANYKAVLNYRKQELSANIKERENSVNKKTVYFE